MPDSASPGRAMGKEREHYVSFTLRGHAHLVANTTNTNITTQHQTVRRPLTSHTIISPSYSTVNHCPSSETNALLSRYEALKPNPAVDSKKENSRANCPVCRFQYCNRCLAPLKPNSLFAQRHDHVGNHSGRSICFVNGQSVTRKSSVADEVTFRSLAC